MRREEGVNRLQMMQLVYNSFIKVSACPSPQNALLADLTLWEYAVYFTHF